jgi:hypothetical protein
MTCFLNIRRGCVKLRFHEMLSWVDTFHSAWVCLSHVCVFLLLSSVLPFIKQFLFVRNNDGILMLFIWNRISLFEEFESICYHCWVLIFAFWNSFVLWDFFRKRNPLCHWWVDETLHHTCLRSIRWDSRLIVLYTVTFRRSWFRSAHLEILIWICLFKFSWIWSNGIWSRFMCLVLNFLAWFVKNVRIWIEWCED